MNSFWTPSAKAGTPSIPSSPANYSQTDTEAFDPFADYSEFDAETDEEADIYFFRHGRFLTVGLFGGYRGFTENFNKIYGNGVSYGLIITYFFDLRLAMSLGIILGDHSVHIATNQNTYNGNLSLTNYNFDLKYYISTQNLSKGIADINPYLLAGIGNFVRTFSLTGVDSLSRDSTMGLDAGGGIEFPIMKKKSFIGVQGVYHMVNFPDENKTRIDTEILTVTPRGDFYEVGLILGMNF